MEQRFRLSKRNPRRARVAFGVLAAGGVVVLGAFIAVYFLATGTAGLELLGTQSYIQQIFYGVALVAAITIPKVNRDRFLKRKRVTA